MGQVFINYRREIDSAAARQLHLVLEEALAPAHRVYIDESFLTRGVKLAKKLCDRLEETDVLLVLIGNGWSRELNVRRRSGRQDHVRTEIETAHRLNVECLPVLVGRKNFPSPEECEPADWVRSVGLDERLALKLLSDTNEEDIDDVVNNVRRILAEGQTRTARVDGTDTAFAGSPIDRHTRDKIVFKNVTGGALVLPPLSRDQSARRIDPFGISRTPITNRQYERARRDYPYLAKPATPQGSGWGHPDQPVVGLTCQQAMEFAQTQNASLPTFDQWRCAASNLFYLRWDEEPCPAHDYGHFYFKTENRPEPVGGKEPNDLGLLDMIGNVHTWLMPDDRSHSKPCRSGDMAFVGGSFDTHPGPLILEPQIIFRTESARDVGIRLVRQTASAART